MIPIYGFLAADTIGLLIMAYPTDTMQDLINKVQKSASIRVKPQLEMNLIYNHQIRALHSTVQEINMQPLEHFFVVNRA